MDKSIPIGETTKVVEILRPLSSEDRARVIHAAMVLLGDVEIAPPLDAGRRGYSRTRGKQAWCIAAARAGVDETIWHFRSQIQQVFHIADGAAEVIAVHVPGKNKKEQTYNAYVLTGLGQLLLTGSTSFQDKSARTLCEASGCYDSANHAAHLKDRGNEFTGNKERGWTLTAPGLARAAEIIKELTN